MSLSLDPKILFEDDLLLVISKPWGLLSQSAGNPDEPSVSEWCRYSLPNAFAGLIHRLDRNTSGVLLLAKNSKMAALLTRELQAGKICRRYLAWVGGEIPESVRWEHWLWKNEKTNHVTVYRRESPGSKIAALTLKPLRTAIIDDHLHTLAEVDLETGRSHQIRVQCSFEKHALLGDIKYGGHPFSDPKLTHRLGLHAHQLKFQHPHTQEMIEVEDPLPPELTF